MNIWKLLFLLSSLTTLAKKALCLTSSLLSRPANLMVDWCLKSLSVFQKKKKIQSEFLTNTFFDIIHALRFLAIYMPNYEYIVKENRMDKKINSAASVHYIKIQTKASDNELKRNVSYAIQIHVRLLYTPSLNLSTLVTVILSLKNIQRQQRRLDLLLKSFWGIIDIKFSRNVDQVVVLHVLPV